MILRILGHGFHFECENLCRVFYPNEKIKLKYDTSGSDPLTIITLFEKETTTVDVKINGEHRHSERKSKIQQAELNFAQQIFDALTDITGYIPPWGLLTGVRPGKLLLRLFEEMSEEEGMSYFREDLFVSEEKADLTLRVTERESIILNSSSENSFSLYVSIPFCLSRCSYCSFVSHSIANEKAAKIFPDYLKMLEKEIEHTGQLAEENGLKLETIYFGGGTPGVLEPAQFDKLAYRIKESFDLSTLREYNVEMGRADTVTPEKLEILKLHGVDRISINPQTFNQATLDKIGRKHTVKQVFDAYELAKEYDFKSINMDLIAGLPGEILQDYSHSVDTAISLAPENITIHPLALKRSSTLGQEGAQVEKGNVAKKMLEYSSARLNENGYIPYYMYRQSKCVGNLENVGWCKPGREGLYNVFMMEEGHTILAVGAGAVTKLCQPDGNNVERIFNYKYPFEYISGFDVIIQRKEQITDFYSRKGMK